jgi:hypothetical protein
MNDGVPTNDWSVALTGDLHDQLIALPLLTERQRER